LLLTNKNPDLAAFVVWVPQLGAHQGNVADATRIVQDPRATQYWDPNDALGNAFSPVLGLGESAWDVYLLYKRGDTWPASGVPKPDYWMQQLGIANAPRLDGAVFAQHAATMLR